MSSDSAAGEPRGWKFVLRALRYRNYRLFFFGQGVSLIGTWMQRLAMSYLIYYLTGSYWLMGVVAFLSMIPTSIFTPFAGVLLDRWNLHRVIVITQALAMLQAFLLAGLALTQTVTPGEILVLSVFLGLVNAFDMPARQAFVVQMVEGREDLSNAIALNSTLFNGAQLVGPAVAAAVAGAFAALGEINAAGMCFLLNGVSFVAVIIALLAMRLRPREVPTQRREVLAELVEGFRYSFGFPPIRSLLLLIATTSVFGMSYAVLMPGIARQVYHGGMPTQGWLLSATGVGALCGALYLASRRKVPGLERLIAGGAALFGLALIGFSAVNVLGLGMGLLAVAGMGRMLQTASCNTVIQTLAEEDKRGRVMAFYAWSFAGTAPLGSLLAGGVAHVWGAPLTVWCSGVSMLIAAGLFFAGLPRFRRLAHPVYIERGLIPPSEIGDLLGQAEMVPPPQEA
ncbi:MAG TPA: MFS transporter [Armatimonadota bacterium]|jgi:MFS family permease